MTLALEYVGPNWIGQFISGAHDMDSFFMSRLEQL